MIYSDKKIKEIIKENNFNFKKKLGQNFIIDENTINKIVDKSEVDKDTVVIEIGPGMGSLTTKLCEKAKKVICYEIDNSLEGTLNKHLEEYDNCEVVFADFLKVDLEKDLEKYKNEKIYIVANLPYYITTPIIEKIITSNINVDKIVVMMQKEVGNRLKAQPNSKEYNSLSVYISYYFNVKKLMDVSRNIFRPVPNVDSIVIELATKEEKEELVNRDLFFKLIRDSFKQKRKTIRNNLLSYDLITIEKVLIKNDLTLQSRAEQIPLKVFVEIANSLV